MAKIALTGIKPTGNPHIGNLLGAIKPALKIAEKYHALYFIADYHALTSVKDKQALHQQIYGVAATWIAAGLDPEKVVFYRQSDIPEVFELSWILSCFTPKGLLNRAHSYKAAVDNNLQNQNDPDMGVNMGHYNYPILMAADILMFNSNVVPVGQDQRQHLEMTRDIAHWFNQNYKKILVIPEALIQDNVKTIPGIDGRKMSKSYHNEIPLYVPSKQLKKKVMQIVTDSKEVHEPKDPENCNLFSIYKLFAEEKEIQTTHQQYLDGGLGYGQLKQALFELIDTFVNEGRERYDYYMNHTELLDQILLEGASKARKIATPLLKTIRQTIGIEK
ncbi:MAG: tryptophan--tRNA ligase [Deltaproteobacteria bacterium]|nr:tryptophan--tRNA ligase [Deltaproteobacteria bacterium]